MSVLTNAAACGNPNYEPLSAWEILGWHQFDYADNCDCNFIAPITRHTERAHSGHQMAAHSGHQMAAHSGHQMAAHSGHQMAAHSGHQTAIELPRITAIERPRIAATEFPPTPATNRSQICHNSSHSAGSTSASASTSALFAESITLDSTTYGAAKLAAALRISTLAQGQPIVALRQEPTWLDFPSKQHLQVCPLGENHRYFLIL